MTPLGAKRASTSATASASSPLTVRETSSQLVISDYPVFINFVGGIHVMGIHTISTIRNLSGELQHLFHAALNGRAADTGKDILSIHPFHFQAFCALAHL